MTIKVRAMETRKLGDAFRQGEISLQEVVARTLEKHSENGHMLLFVDQFEELYTLCPETDTQRRFVDQLLSAVEDEKAVISSGSEVGIKVGDVFEMQGIHGAVKGPDGTRYRIPGIKIDEIEIVAVAPGQSMGISVSGKAIEVGNTIQVRKK